MRVDLRGIQEGTHPLVLDGRESSLEVDGEAGSVLRGFLVEGTLSLQGEDCRVRGSLTGTLETACDRCLTRFDRSVRTTLEVCAVVRDSRSTGGRGSVAGTDRSAPGIHLDLTESLREAVLLDVPIKNLCRAGCRGICPACGVNRNEEPCDCDPKPGDPRWDALRRISFPSDPQE